MNLPIDIASTKPLKFKWRYKVDTLNGPRVQECMGALPSNVENVVLELVALCKVQEQEIVGLRRQIEAHAGRIAQQSEMLSRKVETKGRK